MTELPTDVVITPLKPHADDRGVFTETHRLEWPTGVSPAQWGLIRSEAGVLRGVHVHHRHTDYLVLVEGRCLVGLHDLRPGSPTEGRSTIVDTTPDHALTIPPGVAHGFYYPEPSVQLLGVSHVFDVADELGCRFDDPDLGLDWPITEPKISPRDAALPSLAALFEEFTALG